MAAVVSVLMAGPRNTPCCQPKLSKTMGMTFVRRDPKMKPDSGTPFGSSQLGAMEGHWLHGVVKRELGCAAGAPPGVHGLPCQSTVPAGAAAPTPPPHGSFARVLATFVEMGVGRTHWIPFGFFAPLVLGGTPKKPPPRLIAGSWPPPPTE